VATLDARLSRPIPATLPLVLVLAGAALVISLRLSGIGDTASAQTFVLIFTSLAVEALPFVLLGAVVSAAIEVFVPESAFLRLARLPLGLQVPGAALGGLALPVCECGSVPVARRLISRGMHPAAAIAFMLGSPVVNPIVLASTFVAYRGREIGVEMVAGRAALGILVAAIAGWALGSGTAKELLRSRREAAAAEEALGHASEHEHAEGEHGHRTGGRARTRRGARFAEHVGSDFFFMGRFVVVGAALAAALQTAVPQQVIAGVAGNPVIAALALMALAFVLSLCSEADAFVAASFVQFGVGAQMAFLVFGPILDIKLAFLYSATFRQRFVTRLLLVSVPVSLAGSLWFEVLLR
jgi:uncharacterized protein